MLSKKDGIREQFDRDKVIKGMIRACQKRPVTLEQIEKIAEEIEFELNNNLEKEIESSKIGDIVIEKLKQIDKISYVRFASVYREFKDINEFKKELNKLK